MATNLTYDPNDSRLTDVENEESAALAQNQANYNTAYDTAKNAYESAINNYDIENENSDPYKQTQIANKALNQNLAEIEQNKSNTEKDYAKEQAGAYIDWQKQKDPYGANAEKMASAGLTNTGYSESSNTAMYVAYQNRVSVARDSFSRAMTEYENQMNQAKIANDTLLAEIAVSALQKKAELAIEWAQYENTLLQNFTNKQLAIKESYADRYSKIVSAIQEEAYHNSLAIANGDKGDEGEGNEKVAHLLDNTAVVDWSKVTKDLLNQGRSTGYHPITGKPLSGLSAMPDPIPVNDNANERETIPILDRIASDFGENDPVGNQPSPHSVLSSKKEAVSTEYYKGPMNKDVEKYGAFSNGYQPKGISGHGKLTKSGQTYTFNTKTLSGAYKNVTQNVWKAEDGSLWYWDGRQNKYLPYHSGYRRST